MVHRLRREVWGRERTLVLLISEKLRAAQLRGLKQHVSQRLKALAAWRARLANPRGRRLPAERAATRIDSLLRGQHMREVLRNYLNQRPRSADSHPVPKTGGSTCADGRQSQNRRYGKSRTTAGR